MIYYIYPPDGVRRLQSNSLNRWIGKVCSTPWLYAPRTSYCRTNEQTNVLDMWISNKRSGACDQCTWNSRLARSLSSPSVLHRGHVSTYATPLPRSINSCANASVSEPSRVRLISVCNTQTVYARTHARSKWAVVNVVAVCYSSNAVPESRRRTDSCRYWLAWKKPSNARAPRACDRTSGEYIRWSFVAARSLASASVDSMRPERLASEECVYIPSVRPRSTDTSQALLRSARRRRLDLVPARGVVRTDGPQRCFRRWWLEQQ